MGGFLADLGVVGWDGDGEGCCPPARGMLDVVPASGMPDGGADYSSRKGGHVGEVS